MPPAVDIYALGPSETNCYVVRSESAATQAVVVDPRFEVVDIPGHSPGHVAYATDGVLFSGDLLFAGSVGRTDLPGADWDTLVESIRTLFDRFPPETVVYPGHGRATTLGGELARNPFLAELRAS